MSCADPIAERLTSFALGELDAAESARVLEHVDGCDECSRELRFLAEVTAFAARPVAAPAPRRNRRAVWISLASVAAALVAVLLVVRAVPAKPRWSELADRSVPPFVAAELRAPEPTVADDFARAMEGWEARDFERVRAALSQFLERHPEHAPARFWRAIALRELAQLDAAETELRGVADGSQGYLREHALWCLANLRLAHEDPNGAHAALAEIERDGGELAERARELRERIDARR